tara:strand:- start:882 stop:1169 length:288 start_codon:yes stop_codon:yes gene_type:complete
MDNRIDQLEFTLMELGTEMYHLKHQMYAVDQVNVSIVKSLEALRKVLTDKGTISEDDFELAIDWESYNNIKKTIELEQDVEQTDKSLPEVKGEFH